MTRLKCTYCHGKGKTLGEDPNDPNQLKEELCPVCKGCGYVMELEAKDIGTGSHFKPDAMVIDKEMCKALRKYIMDNGYISHEFHPQIHELMKHLNNFLGD